METMVRCPDRRQSRLEFRVADDIRKVRRRRYGDARLVDLVVAHRLGRKPAETVIDLENGGDGLANPVLLQPGENVDRPRRVGRLIGIRASRQNGFSSRNFPS